MKKFFALILVISLLAFAGSAFASTVGHNQNTTPNNTTNNTTGQVTGQTSTTQNVVAGTALAAASVHTGAEYANQSLERVISAIGGLTSAQATEIATALRNALNTLASTLFPGITTSTTLQDNTNLRAVASTAAGTSDADKLAAASVNLDKDTERAIGTVGAVTPLVSGTYAFAQQFKETLYSVDLKGDRNRKYNASAGSTEVVDTAADQTGVAFLDSKGTPTSKIPNGSNGEIAGFVNMLVVMEKDNVYEPVVFTTVESLASVGLTDAQITQSVTTSIDVIQYTKPTTKTSDDLSTPGDSSGGCSTGFAALSLAVLGSFIATRKK